MATLVRDLRYEIKLFVSSCKTGVSEAPKEQRLDASTDASIDASIAPDSESPSTELAQSAAADCTNNTTTDADENVKRVKEKRGIKEKR